MPRIKKERTFPVNFIKWLESYGGGAKNSTQSHQIEMRVLKWLKFCCQDADEKWDIPLSVVDYCIGSVKMLGDFYKHLKENWKMASCGCISYLDALSGGRPRFEITITLSILSQITSREKRTVQGQFWYPMECVTVVFWRWCCCCCGGGHLCKYSPRMCDGGVLEVVLLLLLWWASV